VTIHEPTTVATDLALAAFTAFLAARLVGEAARAGSAALRLWGAGLAASAGAAFLGGIFHGVAPEIDSGRAGALWKATLYAGGATSFLLAAAAVTAAQRGQPRRVWIILAAAKASAYTAVVTARPEFRWLVFEYGSTLLGIAAWQIARRWRPPAPGSGWILAGIAGAFVAALVQRSGFTLHEHFNHNDLYHVLQMGTAALLYRGRAAIREPSVPLRAS
jgi:uncharacterized protein DUF6962